MMTRLPPENTVSCLVMRAIEPIDMNVDSPSVPTGKVMVTLTF
jgi:hypothetical protein